MDNEQEVLEQNQSEQEQNNEQPQNDPSQQILSAPQFDPAAVTRAVEAAQNLVRIAQEDARQARAEAEALRNRQPAQPVHDFASLNERAANGQFAEATADIVAREMDRRMQPIMQENALTRRSRELMEHLNRAVSVHQYRQHLTPFVSQIANEIATAIGTGEISYDRVSDKLDVLIARALMQNPTLFSGQPNAPAAPAPSKPLPPSVPQGRPSPLTEQAGKKGLTEAEKFMKEQMGLKDMADDEFRELYYKAGQSRTVNITPKSV